MNGRLFLINDPLILRKHLFIVILGTTRISWKVFQLHTFFVLYEGANIIGAVVYCTLSVAKSNRMKIEFYFQYVYLICDWHLVNNVCFR